MNYENDYLFYCKNIMNKVKQKADEYLKDYEITYTQFGILLFLSARCNEITTQKNLEEYFELSHTTIIGILRRLEKNGFIHSTINPDDKRSRIIMLKQRGIDLIKKIEAPHKVMHLKIRSILGEEKFKQFNDILTQLYENCDKIFEAGNINMEEN